MSNSSFPFTTSDKDGFEDITVGMNVGISDIEKQQDDKKQPLFDAAQVNDATTYGANVVPIIEDNTNNNINTRNGVVENEPSPPPPSSPPRFNDPTVRISSYSSHNNNNIDPTMYVSSDYGKYHGVPGRPKGHSFFLCGCDMKKAVLIVNCIGLASVCLGLDPCFPRIIMNTVLDPFYYFERPKSYEAGDDYYESHALDENYDEAYMSRTMYVLMIVIFALCCAGSYGAGIFGALYWKSKHMIWATTYYAIVMFVCILASEKLGIFLSMVCLYPHLMWLIQYHFGDGYWVENNYMPPEQHWWNMFWVV